jgi:hypothetical protein
MPIVPSDLEYVFPASSPLNPEDEAHFSAALCGFPDNLIERDNVHHYQCNDFTKRYEEEVQLQSYPVYNGYEAHYDEESLFNLRLQSTNSSSEGDFESPFFKDDNQVFFLESQHSCVEF